MDPPSSETPSGEVTEVEPVNTSNTSPATLGKTLSNINDNLQVMSQLLLKLTSDKTDLDNPADDQRSISHWPTGHPDTPYRHSETPTRQFDMSTGQNISQTNSHMFDNQEIPETSTGFSRGKQRLGPALSSKFKDNTADDALSIHASDSEGEEVSSEVPLDAAVADLLSNKNSKEINDIQGILDTLAQALESPSDVSDDVSPKLAEIVNSRLGKLLSQEKLTPILNKYLRPGNCEALFPVKVNKEAWVNLRVDKKQYDLRLANLQQTLQKIAIISLNTTDFLLTKANLNNDAINKHVSANVDALALLGHATASLSSLRRASLKSTLKPEYQSLCSNTDAEPHSPFLFGEDFGKMVKDIDESRKIGRALKSPGGQKAQTSFTSSNRMHPYRHPTRRPQNDFLWKGPQNPPFRKKPYFSRRPPPQQKRQNPQQKQF
eukprot:gene1544-1707_t